MTSFDLRARVAAILATVLPLAECGTSQTNADPCDGNCSVCPYKPVDFSATYFECDAGDDASVSNDCFATCVPACNAHKPSSAPCKDNIGICSTQCTITSEDAGVATAQCSILQICGRRTAGIDEPRAGESDDVLARYLAHAAWLEAASVKSFRRLVRELTHHGAPASLVAAARSAARDEIRHARIMTALALTHGASVPKVFAEHADVRSLEVIAIENAIEGCVRETYGALVAAWQAATAQDPAIREAMSVIARDELRHAELGFEIADWIEPRLDRAARDRLASTRRDAVRELSRDVRAMPPGELLSSAGVPTPHVAAALVARLFADAA